MEYVYSERDGRGMLLDRILRRLGQSELLIPLIVTVGMGLGFEKAAGESFNTVINAPPDPVPSTLDSDTQLNVFSGAMLGNIDAGLFDGSSTNVEVNVFGGQTSSLDGRGGVVLNITGGEVREANAYDGAVLNISGGELFDASAWNSELNMTGGMITNRDGVSANGMITVSGGEIRYDLSVGSSGTLDFLGGTVGRDLTVHGDASATMSGGEVWRRLEARPNSSSEISGGVMRNGTVIEEDAYVKITGGRFGEGFRADPGSELDLYGGQFMWNRTPTTSLPDGVYGEDLFTGVLQDGTVFVISSLYGDEIHPGTTLLVETPLPTAPPVVNVPSDPTPKGIRPGQTVNLGTDGDLGDVFASVGGVLNMDGGQVGDGFYAVDSTVSMAGGSIGDNMRAFNSQIQISGGSIGHSNSVHGTHIVMSSGSIHGWLLLSTSHLTMTGGTLGSLRVSDSSSVVLDGGTLDGGLRAGAATSLEIRSGQVRGTLRLMSGASATISDGDFGRFLLETDAQAEITGGRFERHQLSGSGGTHIGGSASIRGGYFPSMAAYGDLTVHGSFFMLDGVSISDLNVEGDTAIVQVPREAVLSGVLSDGTPFIWRNHINSRDFPFIGAPVSLVERPAVPPAAAVINIPGDTMPSGLEPGQVLNVLPSGVIDREFVSIGAQINISSGEVVRLTAVDSMIHITGGSSGLIDAGWGVELAMEDGLVSHAIVDGQMDLSGGQVDRLDLTGTLVISGGNIDVFNINRSSTADIYGGSVGHLDVRGELNLFGGEQLSVDSVFSGGRFNLFGGTVREGLDVYHGGHMLIEGGSAGPAMSVRFGGIVDVNGGNIGSNLRVQGTLNVDGGHIGSDAFFADGAEVVMHSGSIGDDLQVQQNARFDMFGGAVGDGFTIDQGQVNIHAGVIGSGFHVRPDSDVLIAGAGFADGFTVDTNAGVVMLGDDFRIDGSPIAGLVDLGDEAFLSLDTGELFTATLNDGTVIFLGDQFGDQVSDDAILLRVGDLSGNPGGPPRGARPGQTLNVLPGMVLADGFRSADATVNVVGGSIGDLMRTVRTDINVHSGSIGDNLQPLLNTNIEIHGGSIGDNLTIRPGIGFTMDGGQVGGNLRIETPTPVSISGGQVGWHMLAAEDTTINVSGGAIGLGFETHGQVHLTGGQIGDQFIAHPDSTVHVDGGDIGGLATANDANIHITEGTVNILNANDGTVVNMTGGEIAVRIRAFSSTVNLAGGRIERYLLGPGSELHLSVLSYELETGDSLASGDAGRTTTTVLNTDELSALSGILADGTPFDFKQNEDDLPDLFHPDIAITVTVIPEPGGLALLGSACLLLGMRRRSPSIV